MNRATNTQNFTLSRLFGAGIASILLMLFFVMFLIIGLSKDSPLSLSMGASNNLNPPIIISLQVDGSYLLDGLPIANLTSTAEEILKYTPNAQVVVQPEMGSDYAQIVTTLSQLKQAGIYQLSLIT